jgi:hypothetical protein
MRNRLHLADSGVDHTGSPGEKQERCASRQYGQNAASESRSTSKGARFFPAINLVNGNVETRRASAVISSTRGGSAGPSPDTLVIKTAMIAIPQLLQKKIRK